MYKVQSILLKSHRTILNSKDIVKANSLIANIFFFSATLEDNKLGNWKVKVGILFCFILLCTGYKISWAALFGFVSGSVA